MEYFDHRFTFHDGAGIEVNPSGFVLGQCRVGAHLHGGDEGAEWSAATRGEEHDMTARGSQSRRCHKVVAGGREQVESLHREAFAIGEHALHSALATLLCATQRFLFQCGDAASLVAR